MVTEYDHFHSFIIGLVMRTRDSNSTPFHGILRPSLSYKIQCSTLWTIWVEWNDLAFSLLGVTYGFSTYQAMCGQSSCVLLLAKECTMQLVGHLVWMDEDWMLCAYRLCICCSVTTLLCCLGRVVLVMIGATSVL